MAIEERTGPDGKKRYLVRIEGVDPITGKRKRIRAGQFSNRKAAERAQAEGLLKRDRGSLLSPDTTTVAQLLSEWLATMDNLTSNSRADYAGTIRTHLAPALGSIRVQRLTTGALQAQYATWRDAGLSPRVIRGCHMRLSQALDYAVRMQLLTTNVARNARPPSLPSSSFDTWTPAEVVAFLAVAERSALSPLWHLLVLEGMRRGEALGLRWRDLLLDRSTAHIRQTVIANKAATGAAVIQERTKTRAGSRTVHLTGETLDRLAEHRPRWLEKRVAAPTWADNDLIICTGTGTPINPNNVTRAFNALVKSAGLRRIKVHELRHTCATMLLLGGVPAKVVSEKLGHTTIGITLDIYSHVLPAMQADAAATLTRMLQTARTEAAGEHPGGDRR